MRGRVRFRIAALCRNDRLKHTLEAGLGGNGIRSVTVSTRTGSLLVLYEPSHPLSEIERRVHEAASRPLDSQSIARVDEPAWHSMDAARVLAALGSSPEGLGVREAAARLRQCGPNALPKLPAPSQLARLGRQLGNLPVALLAATAVLSLLTGGTLDAAVVLAVVVLNAAIGFASESWTEQTIAALERGEPMAAHVLRDGVETALSAERLVPGDVVVLRRDDPVPADARVVAADGLSLNEAALTGESAPVAKADNVLSSARAPIAERHDMVFRGSMVVGGSGRAVVVATGDRTELARVQTLLGNAARPETPLQQQLDHIGRRLVLGAVLAAALMLLVGLVRGRRVWSLMRSAVSLGVAAIPEGLPTMVTTSLAVGARRLSRNGLLVRRFEAIEALGSVRLVCFDKTGTLTLNRMSLTRLRWNGGEARLTEAGYRDGKGRPIDTGADRELARLIEVCVLCNDAQPTRDGGGAEGSSTETALLDAAGRLGIAVVPTRARYPRLAAVERAEGRRYMATLHDGEGERWLIAVKGDPNAVLELCNRHRAHGGDRPLDKAARAVIAADNLAMADVGLRVLGVASREVRSGTDLSSVADLTWLGMVGMADPIRPGAAELVRTLRHAGIATVMLTGDQPATAAAIAAEAGLAPEGGAELVELNGLAAVPAGAVGSHCIFARLTPAQKLEVVAGLQRSGMRVAMIGDGVNDSPALKAADVGITLAASATVTARDIADIVLLGEDLAPLVEAFASGRAVRGNIRRAIRFLMATNMSEILLMLFATATGLARPLSPGQLLWINLVTDVLPAMGLALEPPDPAAMAHPPPASSALMSRADLGALTRDAGILAAGALAAEAMAGLRHGPETGIAVGFASLATTQLCYTLACRPRQAPRPCMPLTGALAASFAIQGAALFLPGLRRLAGGSLGISDLALVAAAAAAPLPLFRALGAGETVY